MEGKQDHQIKESWQIDLFRPEDAPGVVELYRAVYGDNYPVHDVYDPEFLIKQSAGEAYRVVCRTDRGEIVGHIAFYRSSPPNRVLYEYGQMMVRQDYRTSPIAFELADYAIKRVPQHYGLESIWGEAVCNHVFTQRMIRDQGFNETALEIDLMPGESYEKAFAKPNSGRISALVAFRTFKKRQQTIFVPPVYQEILSFIYEGADSNYTFLQGNAPLDQGIKTKGEIRLFAEAGVARLTFLELGGDFEEVFHHLEQKALVGGAVIVQVFFPLNQPSTGAVVDILRTGGYFLGGALPSWFADDGMLMQKVMHIPNFAGITLCSKRAKKLLALIKADWQATGGGVQ